MTKPPNLQVLFRPSLRRLMRGNRCNKFSHSPRNTKTSNQSRPSPLLPSNPRSQLRGSSSQTTSLMRKSGYVSTMTSSTPCTYFKNRQPWLSVRPKSTSLPRKCSLWRIHIRETPLSRGASLAWTPWSQLSMGLTLNLSCRVSSSTVRHKRARGADGCLNSTCKMSSRHRGSGGRRERYR